MVIIRGTMKSRIQYVELGADAVRKRTEIVNNERISKSNTMQNHNFLIGIPMNSDGQSLDEKNKNTKSSR